MIPTNALLGLSESWREQHIAAGEMVIAEGGASERLLVLVDGSLEVRRGDEVMATIDQPGACVGEIALLLGSQHTADVVATRPSTVRVLDDAQVALTTDAALLRPVAAILASRLRLVTAYLGDLQTQYAGSGHGLGMVSEVLGSLTQHTGVMVEPGSDREPDAPY